MHLDTYTETMVRQNQDKKMHTYWYTGLGKIELVIMLVIMFALWTCSEIAINVLNLSRSLPARIGQFLVILAVPVAHLMYRRAHLPPWRRLSLLRGKKPDAVVLAPATLVSALIIILLGLPCYFIAASSGIDPSSADFMYTILSVAFLATGLYAVLIGLACQLFVVDEGIIIQSFFAPFASFTQLISTDILIPLDLNGRRLGIRPISGRTMHLILWTSPDKFRRSMATLCEEDKPPSPRTSSGIPRS
jgi:hypothetical protein